MWTWADGCDAFPFSPTRCFCFSTLIPPKRTEVWPPPRSLRPSSSKVKLPLNCRPMVALGAGPEAGTPPHSRVVCGSRTREVSVLPPHTQKRGLPGMAGPELWEERCALSPGLESLASQPDCCCLCFASCFTFSSSACLLWRRHSRKGAELAFESVTG